MDIVRVEKISNEKWLNLFAATFRYNGHTGRWVFASRKVDPHRDRDRCDAVIVVPILHDDDRPPRLVVLREFRVPVGDYVYALPAGLLEPGEAVEAAVRRELTEETGLEVVAIKRVSPQLYSTAGMSDESVVMVFADVRATPGIRPQPEASEEIEVLLLDHAEVCRLCADPVARFDAKAWMALFHFQQLGQLA
jgi:ADP-ribose pyrophosphatase